MNAKLQEWAENKRNELMSWVKEYDSLCEEEGIEENPMLSLSIDREYISSLCAYECNDAEKCYMLNTECWFYEKKNSKQRR